MINESGWMLSELLTCFQAPLWFRKQRLIRVFYHFYPLINIHLFCSHHLMIFLCVLITRHQIHQSGESLREERSAKVWQAVSSNWNSRLWSNIKETLANKERLHRGAPLCTRDPCSLGLRCCRAMIPAQDGHRAFWGFADMFQPSLPRAAVSQCRWVEAGSESFLFLLSVQDCSGFSRERTIIGWTQKSASNSQKHWFKFPRTTSDVLLTEKKAKRLEIQKLKSASASRY